MPSVYSNHLLADESQYQRIGRAAPRNLIINGDFSIWQRGVSQTTSGYGSDDRFSNEHVGSSKTVTRETWPLGDADNINNNKYFSRTTVTSSAGAGNYVVKSHKIESVITTANRDITVSFRAKADAAKNIALEFVQNFGTGGSPSAAVTGIGVTTFALTTSWQTFAVTIKPPSIAGKISGTDNNDSFNLNFWYDAGANLDARTNSLGQQSGAFDTDSLQVEFSAVATDFEYVATADQLARCRRYYRNLVSFSGGSSYPVNVGTVACWDTNNAYTSVDTSDMRAAPTLNISNAAHFDVYEASAAHTCTDITIPLIGNPEVELLFVSTGNFITGNAAWVRANTTSAVLGLTSEL